MDQTFLESLVSTIQTKTGITPVVKGGRNRRPIEYTLTKTGFYSYRLEITVKDVNLKNIQKIQDLIDSAIINVGDLSPMEGVSIEPIGGGFLNDGQDLLNVTYYQVYDYNRR